MLDAALEDMALGEHPEMLAQRDRRGVFDNRRRWSINVSEPELGQL